MTHASAVVNGQGRVVIPVEVRRALGIGPADRLEFELAGDGVRLRTAADRVRELRAKNPARGGADATGRVDAGDAVRRERAISSDVLGALGLD